MDGEHEQGDAVPADLVAEVQKNPSSSTLLMLKRDKKSTAHLTPSGKGVCVGISSRGKYEDEIGQETGTYDYPSTQASTYDHGDIDAMRAAFSLGMPIFLIRDAKRH